MRVAKKNVELDIDASDLKHYKKLGFNEIDEKGNFINVEMSEIEKIKAENTKLKKEITNLKKQLKKEEKEETETPAK